MLRLNVLSGTTVLTILGRRALRAAQLSPKIHSQPPNEHKNPVCDAQTSADRTGSASKTASPHPLKSPMLRRKAGDDGRPADAVRASNTETINSKIPKDE